MWCQLSLKGKKIDEAKKINGTIHIIAMTNANLSKFKIWYPLIVYCQPTLSINFTALGFKSPNLFNVDSSKLIFPQLLNN